MSTSRPSDDELGRMVQDEWSGWAREHPGMQPSGAGRWELLDACQQWLRIRVGRALFEHGALTAVKIRHEVDGNTSWEPGRSLVVPVPEYPVPARGGCGQNGDGSWATDGHGCPVCGAYGEDTYHGGGIPGTQGCPNRDRTYDYEGNVIA